MPQGKAFQFGGAHFTPSFLRSAASDESTGQDASESTGHQFIEISTGKGLIHDVVLSARGSRRGHCLTLHNLPFFRE